MYLLLRFTLGVVLEAVLLARSETRMRVAAVDLPDTIELSRSGSEWFTETGEAVELDFLMSDARQSEPAVNANYQVLAASR